MLISSIVLASLSAIPQGPNPNNHETTSQPTAEFIFKTLSVQEMIGRSRAPQPPRLGSLAWSDDGANITHLLEGWKGDRVLTSEEVLLDFLHESSTFDFDSVPDFTLREAGGALMVTGSPDHVKTIENSLAHLRAALVQRIRVQANLYRIPSARTLPALSAANQTASLTEGLQLIWSGTSVCRAGNQTTLSQERYSSYLRDVDVEVAQGARTGDPVVESAFEGVRLIVEPHVMTGTEDLTLFCQFALGERNGPFASRSTGVADLPSVDVPDLDICSGTFSGRVTDGGALLLSLQGADEAGGNMLLTVNVKRLTQMPATSNDTTFFPISAFTSKSMRRWVTSDTDAATSNPPTPLRMSVSETTKHSHGLNTAKEIEALILEMTGVGDENGEFALELAGHLAIRAPQARRDAIRSLLVGLQDRWLRTVSMTVETELLAEADSGSVFPASAIQTTTASDRKLHAVTFPALLGRSHVLVKGRETTAIHDFQVEIAQEKSIADPVLTSLFNGVICSTFPYRVEEGIGAKLDLSIHHAPSPTRRATELADGGDLYLEQINTFEAMLNGKIDVASDLQLGLGPSVEIGGNHYRSRNVLRATLN